MAKRRKQAPVALRQAAPTQTASLSGLVLHGSALLVITIVTALFFVPTMHFPLVFDDVNFFTPDVFRQNTHRSIWSARWISTVSFLFPPWTAAPPVAAWRITNVALHLFNGAAGIAAVWVVVPHSTLLFGGAEPYVQSLGIDDSHQAFLRSVLTQCGFRNRSSCIAPICGWRRCSWQLAPH